MTAPRFGANVLVTAEAVRVYGKTDDGQPVFRQAWASRDAGRYVRHHFDGEVWPGEALGLDLEPGPDRFDLEPVTLDRVYCRLRRLPLPVPEVGIVVGFTRREEGTVVSGRGDDPNALVGPGRRVQLVEVALPTTSKVRIVLAHESDLRELVMAR